MVFIKRKNLILVVHNRRYDPADFIDIGKRVAARAGDIKVWVVGVASETAEVPANIWRDPTLTVAFSPESIFRPERGRVICSRAISKIEQARLLTKAGIATPHCEVFRFGMALDPGLFGSHVLVKPMGFGMSSHGEGIQVFRRERLAAARPEDFSADHHLNRTPLIIQPFIDTGVNPTKFRVLCFCGEVLYAQLTTLLVRRPDLSASDAELEAADVTTSAGERSYLHGNYPEPVALARKVAKVFPDVPLLGIDIIRDAHNGTLYVLEVNAGGNVWHFSSTMWAARRKRHPEVAAQMHSQFGAFDIAAKALIAATRKFAS